MSANPSRVALGNAVREARQREGWSKRAAGARASVSPTTWASLEAGHETTDYVLFQAERVLNWEPGQCYRVMWEARREQFGLPAPA